MDLFEDLAFNLSLLITISVAFTLLHQHLKKTPRLAQGLQGLLFGAAAIIVMTRTEGSVYGVLFDGKSIILSLCGLFGGPVAAGIAALLAGLYRVYLGGPSMVVSVLIILLAAGAGSLVHHYRSAHHSPLTAASLLRYYLFGLVVRVLTLSLYLLLSLDVALEIYRAGALETLVLYPIGTLLIGGLLGNLEYRDHLDAEIISKETHHRLALEGGSLGSWDVDLPSGRVVTNQRFAEILGYAPGEIDLNVEKLKAVLHPTGAGHVNGGFEAFLGGAVKSLEVEHRLQHKDGEWVWVQAKGRVIRRAPDGKPLQISGTLLDISERKQAEEEALRWRDIFHNTRMGVVIGAVEGKTLQRMNAAFAELHGYHIDELTGQPIDIVFAPEVRAEVPGHIQKAHRYGHNVFESVHIRKDGSRFPVTVDVTAVKDDQGEVLYRVANVMDITERKQSELEKDVLIEISQMFMQSQPLEYIYRMLPYILSERFLFPTCCVELYDSDSSEMVFAGTAGFPAEILPLRVPVMESISGTVVLTGQPVVIEDAQLRGEYRNTVLRRFKVRAFICVPLKINNTVLGVLSLADSQTRTGLERIATTIQIIANHFSQEIIRRRTEDALRISEANLKESQRIARLGRWEFDLINNQLHLSDFIYELFETHPSEARPSFQAFLQRIHPDDRARVDSALVQSLQNRNGFEVAHRLCMDDGRIKWVNEVGRTEYNDQGQPVRAYGIMQDLTTLKQAEEAVFRASEELKQAYEATLQGWADALEMRERETAGHSRRVVTLVVKLARALGVAPEDLSHIRRGALLHDIGKMGIPDRILLKDGPLTDDEWVIMRQHTTHANDMISKIPYLAPATDIPYYHHERWDGSGYPRGLKGDEIPLAARIFAVVDVWDALISERPYRPAWPEAEAASYLLRYAGKKFDPAIVQAFLEINSLTPVLMIAGAEVERMNP
jgi:PAS domain S-box-containing protein/putative nucleotidyltransferase with HDIG domain